jgi:glycosyltransferase involved in cell wall biosynthesis
MSLRDLVFDDRSQDNTASVVAAYQAANPQAPVRLFRNKVNRGLAYNFVEGAFSRTRPLLSFGAWR